MPCGTMALFVWIILLAINAAGVIARFLTARRRMKPGKLPISFIVSIVSMVLMIVAVCLFVPYWKL